jgi:hypothetical protein
MPRVFISYSRADLSFVNSHLLEVCREAGYEPWYDVEGIDAADQWERKILQSLLESRWLLLVMSPDSARSEWVKDELQVAFGEAAIRVIPVMWKDCEALDFHIRVPRLQYIDFRKDIQSAQERLKKRLTGVEEPSIPVEPNITMELISIVASLISRFELNHLRNLAHKRTDYTGQRAMRHEIRHLCDLGILVRKENKRIGDMRNGEKHNLAEFVELTPTGQAIVEKLPRDTNPT